MNSEIPQPNLVLVRHGETDGNTGKRTTGFADIALTERGHRQAEIVADEIVKKFGVGSILCIVTTPYIRTQQTASPLIDRTGLEPIVMPGMREITYLQSTKADGMTFDERRELREAFWAATRIDPDYTDSGEHPVDSARSFVQRVHDSLDELAVAVDSNAGLSIVYSHEFPLFTALSIATGKSDDDIIASMIENRKPIPAVENTQAIGLTYGDGRWTLAHASHADLFKSSRIK